MRAEGKNEAMINISGFLDKAEENIVNTEIDLQVNSCGHYRLIRLPRFTTLRQNGRSDFQFLYMAKGEGYFSFYGEPPVCVPEGGAALYLPDAPQRYTYYLRDTPEIYWVHFTGSRAQLLLEESGFSETGAFFVGVKPEYPFLFGKLIEELQLQPAGFERLTALYFQELLALMARQRAESTVPLPRAEIRRAVQHFNQNYPSDICIRDYAKSSGLSEAWFIRSFKEHMGVTPGRYLTETRISRAKDLLKSSSLNVTQAAALTGYQNPLYFSRIFKQITGMSPMEYKKQK